MEPKLRKVRVDAGLPTGFESLARLSRNLLWDWAPEISVIFGQAAGTEPVWDQQKPNPITLLRQMDRSRFDTLAQGDFAQRIETITRRFDEYMSKKRWFEATHPEHRDSCIAYFCAEFGLTASLPVYSGGLGILAGDHLKSSSDLGVPLVAVGLFYKEGYGRQRLDAEGRQREHYPLLEVDEQPLRAVDADDGRPLLVPVEFPERTVHAKVWRVDVGRVRLFLLDTDVEENRPEDRKITYRLYQGGAEGRIRQLMVLGIGGYRALIAQQLVPRACHLNEGHAGFVVLERAHHLMKTHGVDYHVAFEIVRASTLFTTHTPVPAGFDRFPRELAQRYLSEYARTLGISFDEIYTLGSESPHHHGHTPPFNMALLSIRHSSRTNGVSKLHGEVSRGLFREPGGWSRWPTEEVPVDHVTNGIHLPTWTAPRMRRLLDTHLGPDWCASPPRDSVLAAIDRLPDEELWGAHQEGKEKLVQTVRSLMAEQATRRGGARRELSIASRALDPRALTIGFARRFATYKRATLLFSDPERLVRLVRQPDRPVQFVFSGKAHAEDEPGKGLIKHIFDVVRAHGLEESIVFIEDYDISVAKRLVQGVDVWLNNPQRPREASGTSGMKVVPNGGLNLSILDGWWAEGYSPEYGWMIGDGSDWEPESDAVEARSLYDLLERDVVRTYYDRDASGCPRDWVRMMKGSMKSLTVRFSSDRMVAEYVDRFYAPAVRRYDALLSESLRVAKDMSDWRNRITTSWKDVEVLEVRGPERARLEDASRVEAEVRLGALTPSEVEVQLYHGRLDAHGRLVEPRIAPLAPGECSDGVCVFGGELPFESGGTFGYTVRVLPRHDQLQAPEGIAQICWAEP